MANNYNQKIMVHKFAMESEMNRIASDIRRRAMRHDNSKQSGLELTLGQAHMNFHDSWGLTNRVAPNEMMSAIAHHHVENDHHPEHFTNGMKDMNIQQLAEMVCDIITTAKENSINEESLQQFVETKLSETYNIGEPLRSIIINTARQSYTQGITIYGKV